MCSELRRFSQRILNISASKASEMSDLATNLMKSGHNDVISLAVGEPGFHSPDRVKQTAKEAIDNNLTHYTPVDGITELKEAIAKRYQRDYKLDFHLDEICVTTGAKHSLHNVFNCILDPGDEVLLFSPFWTSYPDMVKLAQGKPVIVKTSHTNGFQPKEKDLRERINSKTKVLVLNIPHNPTGTVLHRETLLMISCILKDYPQIWVISDDIYDMLIWGVDHHAALLEISPQLRSRYIIVNGVSKSYAMAGWRIGYIIAPKDMIKMSKRYQSQSVSCACSISQYASVEALKLPRASLSENVAMYQKRVSFCFNELKKIPQSECLLPRATFYLFPYFQVIIERLGFKNDVDFCMNLLEVKHLAVMPGSAFGAPGYLRFSCADNIDKLGAAMKRLIDFTK